MPPAPTADKAPAPMSWIRLSIVTIVVLLMLAGVFGAWHGALVISGKQDDLRYKQFIPMRDPERRLERLASDTNDKLVDMTAFTGLPELYADVVSKYVESVFSAIKAAPITRRRFYDRARDYTDPHPYPDWVDPVSDRDVIVPLVVLPRPDVVRWWSASTKARSSGWLAEDDATKDRGSVYGRTLIFKTGRLSEGPVSVPASPFDSWIRSWDLYTPDHDRTFFLDLGKLVVTPSYYHAGDKGADLHYGRPKDEAAPLQLGEKGGAELLGELITVPAFLKNQRLRWVSIRNASNVRRFLAYSLLDGNGVKREKRFQNTTIGPISPYVRPLICDRHQPRIKQHDELLLPAPSRWPPTSREYDFPKQERIPKPDAYDSAHEEWCLDDWFPAQKEACWVIREADGSKPLQESFLLMPAVEKSDRPVFFIALFAETEPKQLVQELAGLYNVSAGNALDSPEAMERLNSLYEKVRNFPLAK